MQTLPDLKMVRVACVPDTKGTINLWKQDNPDYAIVDVKYIYSELSLTVYADIYYKPKQVPFVRPQLLGDIHEL